MAHFSLLLTGLADGLATSSSSTVHDQDVALVSGLCYIDETDKPD